MNGRFLHIAVGGFVGGVFVRSFFDFGAGFWVFLLLLGAAVFLANRRAAPVALLIVAAGLGVLRFDLADRATPKFALDRFLGSQVVLEGVIADEPDVREINTRLTVLIDAISEKVQSAVRRIEPLGARTTGNKTETAVAKVKILATVLREPAYHYGDRVRLTGRLARPKDFADETTLREVPYRALLAKDGIYYEMFQPRIELLGRGEGNAVAEKLFAFKNAFVVNLNRAIPEPHASLLAGLVVGAKQSLGKKLLDDFRTTGVIHIVVLSGYNITIIAVFIERLLSRLRKNLRLSLAALAMIAFAIMVGASATVIRATVMALLALLARGSGRTYQVTRALLLAGVVMLLHNPKILAFDTSFQLSFLATLGLIYVSPLILSRVGWITERFGLREIAVATVATQLFVLPFLLYKTGLLSLVALPVNLLILSAVPLTMFFGFLAGMAGFFGATAALPFAWISYAFLSYELAVVEWFAKLPFASVSISSFPLWAAGICYLGYGVLLLRFYKNKKHSFSAQFVAEADLRRM